MKKFILLVTRKGEEHKVLQQRNMQALYIFGGASSDNYQSKEEAVIALAKYAGGYNAVAWLKVEEAVAEHAASSGTSEAVWALFEQAEKEGTVIGAEAKESGTPVPVMKKGKVVTPWVVELKMLQEVKPDDAMAAVRALCGSTKGKGE
jgi:hypothetical protein